MIKERAGTVASFEGPVEDVALCGVERGAEYSDCGNGLLSPVRSRIGRKSYLYPVEGHLLSPPPLYNLKLVGVKRIKSEDGG